MGGSDSRPSYRICRLKSNSQGIGGSRTRALSRARTRSIGGCSRDEASYCGTGENVRRIGVEDIGIVDARVVVAISAWEADEIARTGSSNLASTNTELSTAWVELGADQGRHKMENNNFMAEHIVSGGKIARDRSCGNCTARWRKNNLGKIRHKKEKKHTKIGLRPVTISALPAYLLNLKPFRSRRIVVVACRRSTRTHVGQHRSSVVRPLKIIPAIIRIDYKKKKSTSAERTLLRSSPFQANVRVSPGLASATREPAVAFGPQLRAGF